MTQSPRRRPCLLLLPWVWSSFLITTTTARTVLEVTLVAVAWVLGTITTTTGTIITTTGTIILLMAMAVLLGTISILMGVVAPAGAGSVVWG